MPLPNLPPISLSKKSARMPKTAPPVSSILPPLICGSATFNDQYNPDPYALPTTNIVHRALSLGVRAFDTSPYYGPAEELLGQALSTSYVHEHFPRRDYFLLTKVGRIGAAEFDYSPQSVRRSVQRSLNRLRTDYLDVVYCHDVEFVTTEEVLVAVQELRRIRDEQGQIKYVGISGYPVTVLCELAELIRDRTGEPLDIVMSYANFTLQNTRLSSIALPRLKAAGVTVVPNASVLGMGLLRRAGPPIGRSDFHPAPTGLRQVIARASDWCGAGDNRIEKVAIRFAVETWMREGSPVGTKGDPASGISWKREEVPASAPKLGVSVIGVSSVEELDETLRVWRSILDGLEHGEQIAVDSGRGNQDREWSLRRQKTVQSLARGIRTILGDYVDYAWASPPPNFMKEASKQPAPWPSPDASPGESTFHLPSSELMDVASGEEL